ncbi:LysR family transcriptional regulator [Erwinia persicina]|uniref:LysR family transcriptional regulator n=1 Tax=Erwinia persicina TaxID=55211 RepID=UPI00177C7FEB|nr:LysR family transcriptional regulator [Erwinia persicina]MBD8163350.1 LysR family transcriptional regulator [Erwinia persicina]
MNLRLLNAFVMLAEKGNYAEAARALFISQPALTKQINLLESQLNVALFSRGRHGTALTSGGRRLLPEAQKVLGQTRSFLHHAGQVAKGHEGTLAVGFGLSSFYLAPQYLAEFRRHFPGVEVTLTDLPSAQQYAQLQNNELQVGFVRVPPAAPLDYLPLFTDRLVLVAADTSSVSVADCLKKWPLLRLRTERGRGLNTQIDRYMQDNGLLASATQLAEDIHTIVALVIAGIGVALLPQSVIHIAPPGLNIIPLTGKSISWQIGVAWNACGEDVITDNFIARIRAGKQGLAG